MALSGEDIERAAALYRAGATMRQIATELGVTESTISQRLRRAGVTTTPRGPARHPASTAEIVRLYDSGLPCPRLPDRSAVSGAWSRYRQARPPELPSSGRWQQLLIDAFADQAAIGVRAALIRALGRQPTRAEGNAARRAGHRLAAHGLAQVTHSAGIPPDNRAPLVVVRPTTTLSDGRLRQLVTAGPGRRRTTTPATSTDSGASCARSAAAPGWSSRTSSNTTATDLETS